MSHIQTRDMLKQCNTIFEHISVGHGFSPQAPLGSLATYISIYKRVFLLHGWV